MALSLDTSAMTNLQLDYTAGILAMVKNDRPPTPRSFFEPPRINAPDIVEFGQGKTYDFFA